jgi:hypothetical protein
MARSFGSADPTGRFAVKIFLWTVSAALLLLVAGHELGSDGSAQSRPAPTRWVSSAFAVRVPPDLGKGRQTPAVKRWVKRLTAVCEKRNWGIWELTIRQGGTKPLAPLPYSKRVLSNWREFERGISSLGAPPAAFAAEARWIERVNAAKRGLIEAEHEAVLAGDPAAVRAAEAAYRRLSNKTNKGFLMMGLFFCGQFEARQN